LEIAFSRDQDQKIYVTHLLSKRDNFVEKLFDAKRRLKIYVCGSLKMGHDVTEIIKSKVKEYVEKADNGMTFELAFKMLEDDG